MSPRALAAPGRPQVLGHEQIACGHKNAGAGPTSPLPVVWFLAPTTFDSYPSRCRLSRGVSLFAGVLPSITPCGFVNSPGVEGQRCAASLAKAALSDLGRGPNPLLVGLKRETLLEASLAVEKQ